MFHVLMFKFKFVKIKHFRIKQLVEHEKLSWKNSSGYDILHKCMLIFIIRF